jgi:hypothetical protein
VELKDLKVFSEMLNGKSWHRRRIRSCLFAITFSLILIGNLSASVMRIDGGFEDWEDVDIQFYETLPQPTHL